MSPLSRIAIIDIGSNSLRLVVYDQLKRAPVPLYNEKVQCALGRGLSETGVLHPEGVVMAREAMRRFMAMARNMEVASLIVMATAAVRDATDGQEFVRSLQEEHAIEIDVISGPREAKLGAYGVLASIHTPSGISGDLGGGSLELVALDKGEIGEHTSLKLGSLRMIDETGGDRTLLRKLIESRMSAAPWLEGSSPPAFFAIGGSFRALAKMFMVNEGYPLSILHEFAVDSKTFLTFVREIGTLSLDKLEKYPGSAKGRVAALPGAAMVLETILSLAKPKEIVFSACGIREGYLYEKLSPVSRATDGLIATCSEYSAKGGRSGDYARELFAWLLPLLPNEDERLDRIRLASCLMSDIALHIHPEYRADWAFQRILYSSFTCLTHAERVTLALALYHRYQSKLKQEWAALTLITERERQWARLVGSAANLANHLTGGVAGHLSSTRLLVEQKNVRLELDPKLKDLVGESVRKRLDALNDAYRAFAKN